MRLWRWVLERDIVQTLQALETKVNRIMTVLDDYITAQQGFNTKVSADIDAIGVDVTNLNQKIADLSAQLSSAGLTAEQTQALADLTAAGNALVAKADAASASAGTPPTPPSGT